MLGNGVLYCVTQLSNSCLTILELLTAVIIKAVLETELVGFSKTNAALISDSFMSGFPFFPCGKPLFLPCFNV